MDDKHNDSAETGSAASPVKIAVIVFVGAILMVVGIVLLAKFAVSTWSLGASNEVANSAEVVAKRIAHPVSLAVDPTKGPVPGVAAAPVASAATVVAVAAPVVAAAIPVAAVSSNAKASGENIYKASCSACHMPGIAGAPKSGDKAAWAPRIAQGRETLYKHAVSGFQGKGGVMPAKGGFANLSDADVKAAVDYMIAVNK